MSYQILLTTQSFVSQNEKLRLIIYFLIFKIFSNYSADILSDFTVNLWNTLMKANHNSPYTPTLYSSELITKCYFEVSALYSSLFFNHETLLLISTKKIKTLLEMVEQVSFAEDGAHSNLVRLKFTNSVLNDQHLFEICNRNMSNFQLKLVNFIIYGYLNNSSSSNSDNSSATASSTTSLFESELSNFLTCCVKKIVIFKEMKLENNSTVENFLVDFISRYSQRLNEIQVNKIF